MDLQLASTVTPSRKLLSLFCGAGGLDLGFEQSGFLVGEAYDIRPDSVESYNASRTWSAVARTADVRTLQGSEISKVIGTPLGIIGGPPCQSFSIANSSVDAHDPRHVLPFKYARLVRELNSSNQVAFFVFENVPGLLRQKHSRRFKLLLSTLSKAGFNVSYDVLEAASFGVPQKRARVFVVGYNNIQYPGKTWIAPSPTSPGWGLSVRSAIGDLPEPLYFRQHRAGEPVPFHPNHWCMTPRSPKFSRAGALAPHRTSQRSFKTLNWEKPSLTVSYGNREVHIHPERHRRLSVFEAMRLQGFPDEYILMGTLSSQITQISEAVPPPLARAVAHSIRLQLGL